MSRLELAKIKSLTFYRGEETAARRTSPIPQLVCVGKPCKYYQPEAVRCENIGGTGTDVDWKCEADLPESLRFGKVEVSCEGWSRPGDPYVLKGSCSLEYRLVEVPGMFRNKDSGLLGSKGFADYDWGTIIFSILWIGVLFFLAYHFVLSCLRGRVNNTNNSGQRPNRPSGPSFRGSGGGGWFPGGFNGDQGPPPPYTKNAPRDDTTAGGWRPGFWSGAVAGGLLNHLWNRNTQQAQQAPARRAFYDWEMPRRAGPGPSTAPTSFWGGGRSSGTSSSSYRNDDRGEGSSSMGSMRRSTGFGHSNVR